MHLSDVRLGLHTESGRPWEKERLAEVAETLRKAAQAAEDRRIDIVLIAGGLFAHRPVTAELEEANRIFAAHPGTAFVVAAGESDCVKKNSPVLSYRWAENVHYCVEKTAERVTFPALSTVVYVRSDTGDADPCEELLALEAADIKSEAVPPIRVALVAEPSREKAMRLADGRFSYVALGGISRQTELEKDRVMYCGGIEPEGMTDGGVHGFLQGEISPETGTVTKLDFVPMASASYVPLLVKINTSVTPESFQSMIEKEILARGGSNIYRIRITGQKFPETRFELKELRAKYRIADVLDEAEPQYDFEALFEEHQQDMIGYFISTLRKKQADLPDIDRKAMFAGIDALLKTAEGKEERP